MSYFGASGVLEESYKDRKTFTRLKCLRLSQNSKRCMPFFGGVWALTLRLCREPHVEKRQINVRFLGLVLWAFRLGGWGLPGLNPLWFRV